jgi:hypothetical protein
MKALVELLVEKIVHLPLVPHGDEEPALSLSKG